MANLGRSSVSWLLLLLATLAASCVGVIGKPRHITGTLKFKINDTAKSVPLANAVVTCVDNDSCGNPDDAMCTATADSNGVFDCVYDQISCVPRDCRWWDVRCHSWNVANCPCQTWDCDIGGTANPDIQCKVVPASLSATTIHNNVFYTSERTDSPASQDLGLGDVILYPERRDLSSDGKCLFTNGTNNGCGPAPEGFKGGKLGGMVPETWFHKHCGNHDCCYSQCGVSKESCDLEFLFLMRSRCAEISCDADSCFVAAQMYYKVVATIGDDPYAAAQKDAGCPLPPKPKK